MTETEKEKEIARGLLGPPPLLACHICPIMSAGGEIDLNSRHASRLLTVRPSHMLLSKEVCSYLDFFDYGESGSAMINSGIFLESQQSISVMRQVCHISLTL